MRIVFMGSPDFAVPILEALACQHGLAGVVTQPDRPSGRSRTLVPPPVKTAALRLGLPLIQPERLRQPEAMDRLRAWAPDLIVVAAYGQILRPEVLDLPPHGCVNVHGSLLPRWRGAAPIQAAILAGDRETGVTIMKMDPGIDTGPILSQRSMPILPDETAGSLSGRMSPLGAELLLETLRLYLSGSLSPRPQPEEGASYAPMLRRLDELLDPTQPAVQLERRVRALAPSPGTYTEWKGAPLKVLRARLSGGESPGAGRRLVVQGWPALGTGEGILVLEEVQPAGRKPMPGKAFLAGARDWRDHE
jgi:methionyl-tRNA formyltransferase